VENKAVDFNRYQNIYFIDFTASIGDLKLDVDAENKKAFLEELAFAIDKKIIYLDPPNWAMVRGVVRKYCPEVEIRYSDNVFFKDVFRSHPQSLFITGKLTLKINKLGVIKEVKDEKGNKKNIYAAVQSWDAEMKVWIIDGDSGQAVLQETFAEKVEPGTETSAQFNYDGILNKIIAKLGAKLQPRKVIQERYILHK